MNTYYTLRITPDQRECLLLLGRNQIIWKNAVAANAWDALNRQVKEAEAHPNIEDVYLHDAQHGGFFTGEKVLVEATVEEACMSKRLSSQHLPVLINDHSKGAVTATPHVNTVYHMEA